MEIALLYVTHPNKEAARQVVEHLLGRRLIACANFLPIESAYWWRGAIVHGEEVVTILKTRVSLADQARDEIAKLHSYETPCIVRIAAEANEHFARWLEAETESSA